MGACDYVITKVSPYMDLNDANCPNIHVDVRNQALKQISVSPMANKLNGNRGRIVVVTAA